MDYFDILLAKKLSGGGGGDIDVESLTATENGTYNAGTGKAYNPVVVAVPEPTLIAKSISQNGTYNASDDNADGYSSVTVDVEGYQIKNIANVPTDIASFTDGTDLPMLKLEVGIEAVQSGSGDPSPENVRPISGWDAVNVTRCGKNLIKLKDGTYSPSYREIKVVNGVMKYKVITGIALTYLLTQDAINTFFDNPKLKKGTYTFRVDTDASFTQPATFKLMFDDGTSVDNGDSITLDTEKTITSIALQASRTLNAGTYYVNIQVEVGSSLSPYEPYNGTTYTIDLDGTRYGGTLDVVSGVLTVDRGFYTISSGTALVGFTESSTYGSYAIISNIGNQKANISEVCAIASEAKGVNYNDRVAEPTLDRVFTNEQGGVILRASNNVSIPDSTTFLSYFNGCQICYELATPQTIQLTPTQVKSLLGSNNIWADSGQIISGQYFAEL